MDITLTLRHAFETLLTNWCMPGATEASKNAALYTIANVLEEVVPSNAREWAVSDAYKDMVWYVEKFGLKPIDNDKLYIDRSVPIGECIRRGLEAAEGRKNSLLEMESGQHNQYTAAAEAAYQEMTRYNGFACGRPVSFGRRRRRPRRSSAMGRTRAVRRRSSAMGRRRTVRRRSSAKGRTRTVRRRSSARRTVRRRSSTRRR
jgi:hypothetical protein